MASERIIAALGPKASFSDEAARNYLARTMQHARIEYCNSISSCYNAIKNAPDIAIVPILNSTAEASWINYTLAELKTNDLKICGEEILPVRMNLLALQEARLEDITEVCTIEKAFQQCNNYLNTHLQKAKRENASSTSAAAQLVKNSQNSKKAAIANALAAKTYGLGKHGHHNSNKHPTKKKKKKKKKKKIKKKKYFCLSPQNPNKKKKKFLILGVFF